MLVRTTHTSSVGKIASLLFACAGLFACAAAVPVAGDVAGTAIDKTGDAFKAGKAQTHQPVAIDEMIAVTRKAAGELDLQQVGEEKHPDQLKLIYRDQRRQDITVTLVRRTYKATEIRVDVGLFGDQGMGQLMLRQMLHDLPAPAAAVNAAADKTVTVTDAEPIRDSDAGKTSEPK